MEPPRPAAPSSLVKGPGAEEIWLLGQPLLRDYLHFVQGSVRGGEAFNRSDLIDEWRAANDYYEALAKSEAAIADSIECFDLDPAVAPLAESLRADPRFDKTFNSLPSRFGMLELDKLVTYQIHVTGSFADELVGRLGRDPDPASLFRFCQRLDAPEAPVRSQKVGSNRYAFESESTDFRFQESVLLRPDQVPEYNLAGDIVGIVGVTLGFGSNLLSAIHDDDSGRMVLHNGYHRACALRAMGMTHAPFFIRTVSRRDELDLCANSKVAKSPGYYFNAPRPPLLKDYFDPKIRKVLPVKKITRRIEVDFEVKEFWLSE